jgi:hypothetical protein
MEPSLRYLPFHRQRAQVETDADRHAINYSLVAPLRDFQPRPQSRFRAEWVAASSGSVTLLAGTASPLLCDMAGQPESHERFQPRFQEPLQLDQNDRLVRFLVGHVRRIVALIDQEPSRSFALPPSLPLGRMLEKAAAALVVPRLVTGSPER